MSQLAMLLSHRGAQVGGTIIAYNTEFFAQYKNMSYCVNSDELEKFDMD